MYYVATVLAILSGLFYAAGHNEIGSGYFGVSPCANMAARFATTRYSS